MRHLNVTIIGTARNVATNLPRVIAKVRSVYNCCSSFAERLQDINLLQYAKQNS